MKPRRAYSAFSLVLAVLLCAKAYAQENSSATKKPISIVISGQKSKDPKGTATVTLVGRSHGNIRAVDQNGKVEEIRSAPLTIVAPPTSSKTRLKVEEAQRRSKLLKSIAQSSTTSPHSTGHSLAEGDIPPPPKARSSRPSKSPTTPSSGRSQPFVIQSDSVKTQVDVDSNPLQ